MKRIGIFGGTFNPVHIGHLAVAQAACERLKLDAIYFVPSFLPPHKSNKNVAKPEHRYEMVKRAVAGNANFKVSDFEIKNQGKSYSIDTVRYFKKKLPPKAKLFFIIGKDCLKALHTWKDIEELTSLATFVVVNRGGYKSKSSKIKVRDIQTPELLISSSLIRRNVNLKRSIQYLVPDKVMAYIKQHRLYK